MKTTEEITTEIATLKAMKPNVRKTSSFGDNHHDAIEAQIEVLENGMSTDEIYDKWETTDDEDIDFDEGRAENVVNSALEAQMWRDDDGSEGPLAAPSEEWKSLLIK